MFGMGMNEILVILVVAMLFLGPEKLPDAAKTISKGIRDLRKQTREFQDTIENDTEIGGAIRDIKSALRGEEMRRPAVKKPPPNPTEAAIAAMATGAGGLPTGSAADAAAAAAAGVVAAEAALAAPGPAAEVPPAVATPEAAAATEAAAAPDVAADADAEPDPAAEAAAAEAAEAAELASLIKPAAGAIGRGQS
ncbi:MAG: twin-arginine translocase TatA/TatE family subunit [Myxococcales bacterium]|nr:twin-arginine translocase TatA/TatE family subunit [Myxococcales bacterium]